LKYIENIKNEDSAKQRRNTKKGDTTHKELKMKDQKSVQDGY
jgi:hypothetical protein